MHQLARLGEVPRVSGKYYSQFDTVVCVAPNIPAGSRLDPHRHVDVVGYRQLLDLLTTDGPKPTWTDEHWDAFARYLQLVPEEPDNPGQAARREAVAVLDDYRRRFAAAHQRDLHEYVPVPARTAEQVMADPLPLLTGAMTEQLAIAFTGPSGAGKSHTARHAAVAVAANGGIPVWVRCAEYQRGRFSHALSRAVAPFTTEPWLPLLRQAASTGSPVAVILDGFNECAPADQAELLEQLDALRLRVAAAAVVTSTVPVPFPRTDLGLTAGIPDDATRAALLASHGRSGGPAGAEAFQTPLELALAARCGQQLRPGATASELFDAYIAHVCPVETTRAGLRRLAAEMDRQLRGSLTITEIRMLLYRDAGSSAPDVETDAILGSPLLTLTQGRAGFTHELFGRFLTAEQLVLDTGDIAAVADALRDPRHADLLVHAVALVHDRNRRDLLLALADPRLLSAAVRGRYGNETAAAISSEVSAALAEATAAAPGAWLVRQDGGPDDMHEGEWQMTAPRTSSQQALLQVAGTCLHEGRFLEETGRLLDATDRRCAEQMRQLSDAGHRAAISTVVRATYSGFYYTDERELLKPPASVVINACERSRIWRQHPGPQPSPALTMWDSPALARPRWGRLTATLLLLDLDVDEDTRLLPDVFTAAWAANGYHLRLRALERAWVSARSADAATRERMRAALDDCDTSNIFLNSSLFEALAAYGGLDPVNTEESIREEIDEILASPRNPDARAAARRVAGMVFEDQALHGPYAEVLFALEPADYLRLHVMAALSEEFPFNHDWLMNAIVERLEFVDDDAKSALRNAVLSMHWDSPFRQETVGAHLIALRGWAAIAGTLPPSAETDGDIARRAWRIIDELLFAVLRGSDPADGKLSALWAELLDLCAPAAADVLAHLKAARMHEHNDGEPGMYERLLTACPDQVRQVIEWAVRNPNRLTAIFSNGPADDRLVSLIEDLAVIGTDDTATLLQSYASDAEIGSVAVTAIRAIKRRILWS
jgi:hypothetical protein